MKDYKPKARYLNEHQVEVLNDMGFSVPSLGRTEKVDLHSSFFQKSYGVCGGSFTLFIRLINCYFGDSEYKRTVKIKTPYDSWWSDVWNIKNFTEELKEFQYQLNKDIGILIGLGVIEEDNNEWNFEKYIIEFSWNSNYHMGNGELTDDIEKAEFYSSEEAAELELSTFDEPEDFKIKKVILNIKIEE